MAKLNSTTIAEELEQQDMDNQDCDPYIDKLKVFDKAIVGKYTNVVRVRDPLDNKIIVSIRDPKVRIVGYKDIKKGTINIDEAIKE